MTNRTLFYLLTTVFVLTGCTSDDDSANTIVTKTQTTETLLPVAGQKAELTFTTGSNWTATSNASWLTISPTRGSAGTSTVTATTTAINRTKVDRQAQVTIKAGTATKNLTVIQSGKYAIFDQHEFKVDSSGGTVNMTFKSNTTEEDALSVAYYQGLDWIYFADQKPTRAEWSGNMTALTVTPNLAKESRSALFALALPTGDDTWVELDTAAVIQSGTKSGYESTDYSHDGEVSVLQEHATGHGIPVVLMGDGFTDKDIADNTYETVMRKAVDNLFSEEPARSMRDYFDVYMVKAVSRNDAVGADYNTVFSCIPDHNSSFIDADESAVTTYAKKTNRPDSLNMLAIVILNSNVDNGVTYLFQKGTRSIQYAIAFCPICEHLESELFRSVLVHEAIGHGLAKLGDEYGYEEKGQADEAARQEIMDGHKQGWLANLDTTANKSSVAWWSFIDDHRYKEEHISTYEGGYTYTRGIWKPTEQSMMNGNDSPFNAPSRKAIYDRIRYLGENARTSTADEFAAFDALHKPTLWDYTTRLAGSKKKRIPASPKICYR